MTEPKALKDMTWEEAEPIYRAFNEGRPIEEYYLVGDPWQTVHNPEPIWRISTYRVKQTKPSINWDHVRAGCIYLARDASGKGYFYAEIPKREAISWTGYPECEVEGFASYDPGTCDWKDSLIVRPGHEQE